MFKKNLILTLLCLSACGGGSDPAAETGLSNDRNWPEQTGINDPASAASLLQISDQEAASNNARSSADELVKNESLSEETTKKEEFSAINDSASYKVGTQTSTNKTIQYVPIELGQNLTKRVFKIYMQSFSDKVPNSGKLTTNYSFQSNTSYNVFSNKEKAMLDSLKKSKNKSDMILVDYEPPNDKEAVFNSALIFATHLDELISSITKAENLAKTDKQELFNLNGQLVNAKNALNEYKNDRFRLANTVYSLVDIYKKLTNPVRAEYYTAKLKATNAQFYVNYAAASESTYGHLVKSLQPYGYVPENTARSASSVVNIQNPFPKILASFISYYAPSENTAKIGFYGILPWNSYCSKQGQSVESPYNNSIGGQVDYLASPVYWNYCGGSIEYFKSAVDTNIALAKKFQPNKDVYIVLGASFYNDNYNAMKKQLAAIYNNPKATGVLLWNTSATVQTYKDKSYCKVKNANYEKCWIDAVAEFSCEINQYNSPECTLYKDNKN